MPLLYGEGGKAFLRLQSEIIRTTADESIFAWSFSSSRMRAGFLAPDARSFLGCKHIVTRNFVPRQHYEVTHKGIRMVLTLPESWVLSTLQPFTNERVLLTLNCARHNEEKHPLCIEVVLIRDIGPVDSNSKKVKNKVKYLIGWRLSPKPLTAAKLRENNPGVSYKSLPAVGYDDAEEVDIPVYFIEGWKNK